MKMPNITPGPWFVRETGDHYSKRNDLYIIGNPIGRLGGDRNLAMLIDTWTKEQTMPNATAIAALPDVLEALIGLLEYTGFSGTHSEKARAALLKAGCTNA